jgi:subtilase family serine protease
VTVFASFNISTFYNEGHNFTARVDPNNQIAETNEGDNTQFVPYVLQQGSCS